MRKPYYRLAQSISAKLLCLVFVADLETCLHRNSQRNEQERVKDSTIIEMHAKMQREFDDGNSMRLKDHVAIVSDLVKKREGGGQDICSKWFYDAVMGCDAFKVPKELVLHEEK